MAQNKSFEDILNFIYNNIAWGLPVIILLMGTGIWLTIKLRGAQVRHLGESLKYMVSNETSGGGEVSSFGALCISMAATLGTGKIIGVATAIAVGGPGALFWMILAALFGMATKYAEGFLAIRYRRKNQDGTLSGGPFVYIEDGMGKKWKWLAICFAIFGALAGVMGIGTLTQMNAISGSVVEVCDRISINGVSLGKTVHLLGSDIPICSIVICVIVTILSAIAIIGGVKRISSVSVVLVPIMAIIFFIVCLGVVVFNIDKIPSAFAEIFKGAFNFKAAAGSTIGMMIAMREGVSKGVFSNEAGLGSAPIALASAQTDSPVKEGLVCMASTFVDTMVLCLTIGLGVVITGSWKMNVPESREILYTISTFSNGLHINELASCFIVMFCITTFAFTTIIGWNVYGEKCVGYLTNDNKKWVLGYQILYILTIAITPFLTLSIIWKISSIFNAFMCIPNLIALICLSGVIASESKIYFDNERLKKKNKKLLEKAK